ncbi:hypothetical protein [Spirosoma aerophilum]
MKNILMLTLFWGTFITTLYGQNKPTSANFYAIVGAKQNAFKKQFGYNINPQVFSSSIGAGSTLSRNNYLVGVEFLYSVGTRNTDLETKQYVGFSNTLFAGYNVLPSKSTWRLEPTVGLLIENNQTILQTKDNQRFTNFSNSHLGINIGTSIRKIGANGLFFGLKGGYLVSLNGDTQWLYKATGRETGLFDRMNGYYLQLHVGGLLKL